MLPKQNIPNEKILIPADSMLHNNVHEKDRNIFLYSTIHDLKTPVNNIEGLTHILKKELTSKQSAEINSIIEKIERCVSLTQTKLEELTETTKLNTVPYEDICVLNFEEVLNEVVLENEIAIQSNNIIIDHSFDAPQIEYSRTALKSIILNLITNAVKYRSPKRGAKIKLTTTEKNGRIILKVTDNGLGIDLQKKGNKLFLLFKRLHHHVEGSGVGLYLVKKLVERAGGTIEVKSRLNVGTSFLVTF